MRISTLSLLLLVSSSALFAAPLTDEIDIESKLPPTPATEAPAPTTSQLPISTEAEVLINAAADEFQRGDLNACRESLRTAFAKHPDMPPPNLVLASFYLSSGRLESGRRLLDEVALQYPDNPEVYTLFGNLAIDDGHLTDAWVHYTHAEAMKLPTQWDDTQRSRFKLSILLGKAAIAERRGRWEEAVKLLGEAVQSDRQNAQLRDRWATALFWADQHSQALEQFDIAYRQDERINPPEVSMGVMYAQSGDFAKTDEWLEKAIAKYPAAGNVRLEYSLMLLAQDRAEEAKQQADAASAAGLDSAQLTMQRGMIARQLGEHAQAETFFAEAVKASPDDFEASNQLALALVAQNDEAKKQRALELATRNTERFPQHSPALATLGWVNFNLGHMEEAESQLRAAATAGKLHLDTLYYLARVLQAQNHPEQGYAVAMKLKQSLEQPVVFVLRPEARKWIEKLAAAHESLP